MSKLLIGLYQFEGPFSINVEPMHMPGVLAILHHGPEDLEILQLKASQDLNALWQQTSPWFANWPAEELSMAIHYMPGLSRSERNRVVGDILDELEMLAA